MHAQSTPSRMSSMFREQAADTAAQAEALVAELTALPTDGTGDVMMVKKVRANARRILENIDTLAAWAGDLDGD